MNKESLRNELLGISDLAKRWGYKTISGVRKRRKYDSFFPKPVAIINNQTLVFLLSDIERYEALRGKIDVREKHHSFYQTKEEWQAKTREEREKQRGSKYSNQMWNEIIEAEKAMSPMGDV